MRDIFKEQIEKGRPLTQDDVNELMQRRIDANPEKEAEIRQYWLDRVGKHMLFYLLHDMNEHVISVHRIFDDEFDQLNVYEYVRVVNSMPRFTIRPEKK